MTASSSSSDDMARATDALRELEGLVDSGRLTKAEFRRIWKVVEAAHDEEHDMLEALFPHAEAPDWIPAAYR